MKIVVLDGYTLNPGDLSWEPFKKLGEIKVYRRTPNDPKEILRRIGGAEIVLTNKTPLNSTVIDQSPNLKYIGVLATGYNIVDIASAHKRQIAITNIPTYGTAAVAQFTLALLLEICNQVGLHNKAVHQGKWAQNLDFSFWEKPLILLKGKTLGIIGFGAIGQAVAKIAYVLGMKVIFYNHHKKDNLSFARQVTLDELLKLADVISLHLPLTQKTQNLIGPTSLKKMKKGVILLNTARGGLLDEKVVAQALNSGQIYAAGLDVASREPINNDNPLLKAKNCFITPHIAWAQKETRYKLMQIAKNNLKSFLAGKTENSI